MKIDLKTALLLVAGTTALTACINEDDPVAPAPPPNEEEVITTMRLQFLSANGVEQKTFSFTDSDGPGGNPPVTVADTLTPDSTYAVAVLLLNETANPVDTVSHEVEEEGAVHQFFFQVGGANVEVDYSDADVNGNPIGLSTEWIVRAASNGQVTVTLRHQPDKGDPGVASGEVANAGGETDIEG
ncbi:MAG: type 1 periplasmic binding fold superfamily protein, partial [Flavobacteriales bacterium]|nr:type 1 periplasmic binding fold superfamily protein [Flavobacteriales bacterium]